MEGLSEKQIKYVDFMLKQLGFEDGEYFNLYKKQLYEYVKDKRWKREFSFISELTNKTISGEKNFTIVDYLKDEIEFKKVMDWERKNCNKMISATDLANHTFCPASFSINNSFKTEASYDMDLGEQEHEKFHLQRLKGKFSNQIYKKGEEIAGENSSNSFFFNDIRNSKLIYSGHSNNTNKLFYNAKKTFVGNPDYIFERSYHERFIVEEKFRKNNLRHSIFDNHKIQLASYIYGLESIKANYGYLLYWYYEEIRFEIKIVGCKIYKIQKTDVVKDFLNTVFKKVTLLKNGHLSNFDNDKLTPNKCVRCSLNRWCGHKNRRHNDIQIPYSNTYIARLYHVQS